MKYFILEVSSKVYLLRKTILITKHEIKPFVVMDNNKIESIYSYPIKSRPIDEKIIRLAQKISNKTTSIIVKSLFVMILIVITPILDE